MHYLVVNFAFLENSIICNSTGSTSPSHFCKQFQVSQYYCYLASSGVVIPHKLVAELFFEHSRLAFVIYTSYYKTRETGHVRIAQSQDGV